MVEPRQSPEIVYKYVTADRIDVLKDCRIRFTQPAALNDPFESLPCLTEYQEQRVADLHAKVVKKYGESAADLTRFIRQDMVRVITDDLPAIMSELFAFLSLSRTNDNLLMWSHYAGAHTGFVIGFDADNQFFAKGNLSMEGLKDIEYSRERFVMPPNGFAGMPSDEMSAANSQFFFTKSADWAYELEMRILAQPRLADKKLELPGQLPIHLFNLPPQAIRQVIFGFAMQPKIKAEIAGLIEEKYPHVALLQAQVDSTRYALNPS